MDQLANKTAYGSAEWRRERSGTRMWLVGIGLLFLSFPLWEARDFIPRLAMKRVMAIALVSTLHDGLDDPLERAFAAAKSRSSAEVTLEPNRGPALHGRPTYSLSVTADTRAQAQAELATFAAALKAPFPADQNNIVVTLDFSTVPAPNQLSRRISFATLALVLLIVLASQFLMVIGAHREGKPRSRVLATLATPFIILISVAFFPEDSDNLLADIQYAISKGVLNFLVLLLVLTPASAILGLWLTRRQRPAADRHRRA